MTPLMLFISGLVLAYLAGSVNFAILLFKLLGRQDPRTGHSGNPGVTNVFRLAGWPMALLVLLLDVGRAAAVALGALHFWSHPLVPWAALGLILGNHFPCFHGFRGGKGVANYLGFYAVIFPWGTLLAVTAYLAVFALARVPFIGSFAMVAVLAGLGIGRWAEAPAGLAAVLAVPGAIVWFHRVNIGQWVKARRGD